MARLVLTAAGYVVGGYFGYPQLGALVGAALGAALEPPHKISGPKLDDLSAPKLQYGSPWPRLYGRQRVSGIPLYASAKHPTTTTDEQGKGGGGTEVSTTTYDIDVLYGVAIDSGVVGIARVWVNKTLVYSVGPGSDSSTRASSDGTNAWQAIELFDGNAAQLPWAVYEADLGAGNAPAYRHRTTIGITGLALGNSGQMPLVEFEVFTAGTAATAGYRDDFADGVAPYTGDIDSYFNSYGDIYGGVIQVLGQAPGAGAHSMSRNITSVTVTGWSVKFYMNAQSDDDAGSIGMLAGATSRFYLIPRREITFDALQRCHVGVDGVDIALGAGALDTLTWYQLDVTLVAGVGNSIATLTNLVTGSMVATANWPASSFTSFAVDTIRFSSEGTLGTGDTKFSQLRLAGPAAAIGTVDVADIVTAECARVGLAAGNIDVTALAGLTCAGFATTQGARGTLEQLAANYYFEAFADDKLRFVARGGASAATVAYAETGYARNQPGEAFNGLDRADELTVPAFFSHAFPDVTRDYEINAVMSDRLVGQGVEVRALQTSVVMEPAEAKARADTFARDARVAAHSGRVALSVAHLARTPTDVLTLTDVDGNTYRSRIVRMRVADMTIEADVVLDDATVLATTATSPGDGEPATSVAESGATVLELVDAPILRDADDDSGLYVAALVHGAGQGSRIYKSPDGVTFSSVVDVTEDAVIGTAATALGSFVPRVWDEINTVTVTVVPGGSLASSTRDAMQADRTINVAGLKLASGKWEVFRFRTATLVGTNQYKLSGLLRGLLGTEEQIAGHAAGERFVLLRMTGLRRVPLDTGEIGVERYWRGVTLGQAVDTAAIQPFTNTAQGRVPYAPESLRAFRNTSGDVVLTWMRRTRLETRFGGTGGSVSPLGEASEAYEVDIFSSNTYSTLKRTLSATTETATYTSAQQVADFGSNQATVYARVYQLSAVVGRGSKLQAAV